MSCDWIMFSKKPLWVNWTSADLLINWNKLSGNLNKYLTIFYEENKWIWKYFLPNGTYFIPASYY